MKHALILALIAPLTCHAWYETPPSSTPNSRSVSAADAQAGAKAGATSGSNSVSGGGAGGNGGNGGAGGSASGGAGGSSNASGGLGTASSDNSLGGVNAGNDATSVRAYALSLPGSAWTPPLPMACPTASIEQHAFGVGWNFVTKADAYVNTDNCVVIISYNAMIEQCRFESARLLLNGLMRKVMGGLVLDEQPSADLTLMECSDLRHPQPPLAPKAEIIYVPAPAPAPACETPKPKPHVIYKPLTGCKR